MHSDREKRAQVMVNNYIITTIWCETPYFIIPKILSCWYFVTNIIKAID